MRRFALSAIGRDRPGIVAALSGVLVAHGLNLEDSQMSILDGHFTVVLIVSGPADLAVDALRSDLERTAVSLTLDALTLSEISLPGEAGQASSGIAAEPSCIVTVYGADHPGIVHAVASALAASQVNITDLQTRLISERDRGELYAMILEVELPEGFSQDDLEALFDGIRRDQGVDATVRVLEQDVL
ncbi:MAG: glycine cleavage system transcriptional repressor [Solirubrobacteraceae bacterium]